MVINEIQSAQRRPIAPNNDIPQIIILNLLSITLLFIQKNLSIKLTNELFKIVTKDKNLIVNKQDAGLAT